MTVGLFLSTTGGIASARTLSHNVQKKFNKDITSQKPADDRILRTLADVLFCPTSLLQRRRIPKSRRQPASIAFCFATDDSRRTEGGLHRAEASNQAS